MINEYCIVYELVDYTTVMSASEPITCERNQEIKTVVIPAYNMNQAVEYATDVLNISNMKECFELDSGTI